jgi:valyl-tRNA synthetase
MQMTEKRQTSQAYIIRILQHFATKLWNITNFVMLFQAVTKFLSRHVEIKILSITQVVNSVGDFSPPGKTV